jgi:hypothetical protein
MINFSRTDVLWKGWRWLMAAKKSDRGLSGIFKYRAEVLGRREK